MNLLFYRTESGELLRLNSVSNLTLAANISLIKTGESYIELPAIPAGNLSDYYVQEGQLTARPLMNLQVSQDPFRIDNIPAGAEVMYPGGTVVVNDGFVEWSSVTPGVFEFRVSLFPYKEEVVYADFSNV